MEEESAYNQIEPISEEIIKEESDEEGQSTYNQ